MARIRQSRPDTMAKAVGGKNSTMHLVEAFWLQDSGVGVGCRVSAFWLRVSVQQDVGFLVSGFGFWVQGFRLRVSGFGFKVSDFGFRV